MPLKAREGTDEVRPDMHYLLQHPEIDSRHSGTGEEEMSDPRAREDTERGEATETCRRCGLVTTEWTAVMAVRTAALLDEIESGTTCGNCRARHPRAESWPTRSGGLCPECKDTGSAVEYLAGIHPENQHR